MHERVDITLVPEDAVMNRIINSAHGGRQQAVAARVHIATLRKQNEEDGEPISGPTLSEQLVASVQKRYERAQGQSSLIQMLAKDSDMRREFIQSRLPAWMLPENKPIPAVPYSGTVGTFIPRSLKVRRQLKRTASTQSIASHKSNSSPKSPKSSKGSPRDSRDSRMSRSSSLSSLFDRESHVHGVLTFSGRIKAVNQELYPSNPVMLQLIQMMNNRWWSKCTHIRFAATPATVLSYVPPGEKWTLPCTVEQFNGMEIKAARTNGTNIKEEWRDRVLVATLDAFDEFPEIDKFAIQK